MQPDDPKAVDLAKSIRQAETGGSSDPYNQKGASGEFGAYQFMPATYKSYAQKYLGSADAPPTVENQNKIAYSFVKEKKDAGYNPAQIASMWNAGEAKPDAYKENYKGVNNQGVAYDTPAYAAKVSAYYKKLSGGTGGYNPAPFSNPSSPGQFDFTGTAPAATQTPDESTLGGQIAGRGKDVSSALGLAGQGITEATTGKVGKGLLDVGSGVLQTAGSVAGGIGDVIGAGIGLIPGVKPLEAGLGSEVNKLAQTGIGQKVIGGAQDFAANHPVLSKDIGAAGNIAALATGGIGAKVGKDVATQGFKDAAREGLLGVGIKGMAERRAVSDASEILGSKATKAEVKSAVRGGRTSVSGGVPGIAADPLKEASIKEVAKLVSNGTVSRGALAAENAQAIKTAADTEAEQMRSLLRNQEVAPTLQPEELQSLLEKVTSKTGESVTSGENPAKTLLKVFTDNLPKGEEITAENVLDARQAVSKYVLDNRGDWNMRGVLTGFKSARDAFWDESRELLAKMAPDVPIKDMLAKQSNLYRALDYISSNVGKEIGTTRLGRVSGRYPLITGLVKKGTRYALEGAGIGAVAHLLGE